MKSCSKCGKIAFIEKEKNMRCKKCFSQIIEKKVIKTIKKYNMLYYNCHLAVGLSGGKDSIVLLTILKKIVLKNTKLTAVIIDEGIKGYRQHGIEIAIKTAKRLNIPYIVKSYKSDFGFSLDEMLPAPFGKTSCAICGTFRRKALNSAVLEINADFLATGHNMDDEAETILLNLARGDFVRFSRQSRIPDLISTKFIPRIKPLVLVSQPEIVYYAIANGIEYHDDVCPYAYQARRNSIREFLHNQEKKHPGTLINIISVQDKIYKQKLGKVDFKPVFQCKICSEPTDSNVMQCAGCKFIEKLKHAN